VFGIFYSKTLAIYCIPATLVFLLLLLLLELYLRVQHNIDGLREEVKKQNTVNSDDTAAKPDGLKDEVEKLRKVSEETVDLLEILIDSLEEIKKE
jgi:cell division protein FtsL